MGEGEGEGCSLGKGYFQRKRSKGREEKLRKG